MVSGGGGAYLIGGNSGSTAVTVEEAAAAAANMTHATRVSQATVSQNSVPYVSFPLICFFFFNMCIPIFLLMGAPYRVLLLSLMISPN